MIPIKQLSVKELKEKLDKKDKFKLVDCREPHEFEICHIEGSKLIPLSQFAAQFKNELNPDDEIVIHCHHGGRSQKACEYLFAQGFKNVSNVTGGIDAWSLQIDTNVKRY